MNMAEHRQGGASADETVRLQVAPAIAAKYLLSSVVRFTAQARTMLGQDRATGDSVVVKALRTDALSRGARARLEHEASIRRQLDCQPLVPVRDYAQEGDEFYIVMPFVTGTPLTTRLQQGPISVEEALIIGEHLFEGLRDLHQRGALHRDIKPANIITNDVRAASEIRWAKLVDIGTIRNSHSGNLLGEPGCETLAYLSPEAAGSIDADVGEPSDLYAAGVLLFHCLAGHPPFCGQSAGSILFEHLTAPVPDLRCINPAVPRELDALIQHLLSKDPDDRYQLASAAIADLKSIRQMMTGESDGTTVVIGAVDRRGTLTEPAFVARSKELERVKQLIDETRQGRGSTMLIEGESGSGKSRLLVEVAKQARQDGMWVLRGHGTTHVADKPFQLLEGVVDGFLSAANDDPAFAEGVRERLGGFTDALCESLPRLREVLKAEQKRDLSPAAFGENRTIQALSRFLDALGTEGPPTAIILDDCQWADDLTYKLLQWWQAQPASSARCTSIIVGFRSEEVDDQHVLRRTGHNVHLRLAPLSSVEVGQLAESMAGRLPDEAVAVVVQLAEGSPFMASAVLRGLVETGALISEQGSWRVEPHSIADLQASRQSACILTKRIELLPAETIRLLSVGAVVGKEFGLDMASALTELATSDALELLSQARMRRLIWARPDGGQFAFVHDQVRTSLLDRLSQPEQRELHRLAAHYLTKHTPSRVSDIAFHFDAAGESQRALPYSLQAAEQARSQFSLEVAERQYRIAERGARGADRSIRFRVATGLGDTLMLRGRYTEAAPLFEQAATLAEGSLTRAQIQGKLAELCFKRGDMENATRGFEEALRTLGRFVPRTMPAIVLFLLWEAIMQLAHTCFPNWLLHRAKRQPTEAESLATRLFSLLTHGCWYCRSKIQCLWAHLRGLNLAEKFPPTPELAHAYSEHAPVMCLVPLFGRAIRYSQRSLELRKSFNDVWGQGQSLNFLSCVLYAASRYRECVTKGREAIRLLERTGDYWQVHIARYQVAASLYHLGDFAAAIEEANLNHSSGLELGDEQASGIILDVWARASRGKLDETIVAAELARERQDSQGTTQVLLAEGIRHLYADRLELAKDTLEKAAGIAARAGIHNAYTLPTSAWLATAWRRLAEEAPDCAPHLKRQRLRRARKAARKAIRFGKICKNDMPRALREAALVDAMQGRHRRARRRIDQSLQVALQQEATFEYAETLRQRGQVGRYCGWPNCEEDVAEGERLLQAFAKGDGTGRAVHQEKELGTLSLADRFETLLENGRKIASALSVSRIYEEAQTAALRLLRGEHCLLLEFDQPDEQQEPSVVLKSEHTSYSQELLRRAIQRGRAVAFAEELPDESGSGQAAGQRSALCVPVNVRGRIAACLYVTHGQVKGLFGADEERLADFVAAIAGAALENAQGFKDLETLNATLEHRVAERTKAAESRAADLAQSNEKLERIATELLAAKDQLRDAKEVAEAANEAKSRFLATMSHEIRTPMNGILGMTEIAMHGAMSDSQRNCLTLVKQSGEALLSLLNDILDLSKIEAGKMALEAISMQPHTVINSATKLMGFYAAQKGVELICRISPEVPGQTIGDPCRLRQIVVNLVGNAIKFTDEGEVFVDSFVERDGSGRECLHVAVHDTGPGIPREKQSAIFGSFQQSDSSTTRRYGGTGLGLSISSQLVSLMDGQMYVESEVGRGSTFHFTIPLCRDANSAAAEPCKPLDGYQVLLFCDRSSSRRTYAEILDTAGARCTGLPFTQESWKLVEDLRNSQSQDWAVLLDIEAGAQKLHVPAALKDLESLPLFAMVPPSGAPSAVAEIDLKPEQCLFKPVAFSELVEFILGGAKDPSQAEQTSEWSLAGSAIQPLHVLVADDGPVNQEVAAGILELLGHTCETASTGQEAIEALERTAYDVIFMDLEMPVMDGIAAVREIRSREAHQGTHTPVIAMTAHALTGIRERCLAAGMDDYLVKPIQPDSLAQILKTVAASIDQTAGALD